MKAGSLAMQNNFNITRILSTAAKWRVAHLLAFVLLFQITYGQEVNLSAKLDRSTIRIGEQVKLQLVATYSKTGHVTKLTWPVLKDTVIGKVEIVTQSAVLKDSLQSDASPTATESKTIVITSFDSGYYAIPPFKILINGDSLKVAESEPLMLQVQTLAVDTTKAIKDIKTIHEVPFSFDDIKGYILIGLAVAILAVVVYLVIRKNKIKPVVLVPKAPPVLPHVEALSRLEKLRADKLWQNGQEKLYHSGIADVLREYISKRFPVNARELTTDEIMLRFRKINISRAFKDQLYQVLYTADMVKFAKEQPLPGENEQCLEEAIAFIKNTMPMTQAAEKQTDTQAQDNG